MSGPSTQREETSDDRGPSLGRRWPLGRHALVAVILLGIAAPSDLQAAPPPERVVVPLGGGRPQLPGTPAPKAGATLPSLVEAERTVRPPAVAARQTRRAEEPPPRARPKPRRPAPPVRRGPPPDFMVLLDGGSLFLPDAALRAVGYEGFASVQALALDVAAYRVASERHAFGGRLGVAIPTMPAQNWWQAGSAPTYIDIDAVLFDLAVAYAYWRPLFGRLSWIARAELGFSVVAGSIRRVATLPTCAPGAEANCPHWRSVGELSDPIPSPILPSLRLTTGLAFELGAGLHVRVEAGLRDLPWWGVGFGFRR